MELVFGFGLLVGTVLLFALDDWRFKIGGLLCQYFFVAAILALETIPTLAAIKAVVGLLVTSLFFLSVRSFSHKSSSTTLRNDPEKGQPATGNFRYLIIGLSLAIAFGMTNAYPLKDLLSVSTFSFYWLASVGVLSLVVTRDMLRVGYSLLTISSAIDIFGCTVVDTNSLIAYSLNNILSVIIAFSALYLVSLENEAATMERQET